jgi:pimeloyl-ACP methyl ester carboxylesterase
MMSLRRRLSGLALVAAAIAIALIPGMSAAASASTQATLTVQHRAPKPTIVLVHGAFADSSSWDATIAALQARGFPVIAAPNPLRGLTSDSDYVRSILQTISGPIILVGHSYGGAVITNAARGVPNVKALVFVAGFALDQGESLATTPDPQKFPGSLIGPDTTIVRPVPNAAAPNGQDVDISIKPEDFRAVFAADVPKRTADLMAVTQRPLAGTALGEPSGAPAWKTIPSWDLVTLDDKAIAPAGQMFMAERANAHIETVHSSHAVMVSHPGAVVDIILDAAAHVSA